jgi:hypothetical protein
MSVPVVPPADQQEGDGSLVDPTFHSWRRVHRSASMTLAVLATVHAVLTMSLYGQWSADAVWFLGTGLGLLLLAGMNLAHVGLEPCRLPTARAVRAANWVFVAFGASAFIAVPEPQAAIIVVAILAQAVTSHRTLPGAA